NRVVLMINQSRWEAIADCAATRRLCSQGCASEVLLFSAETIHARQGSRVGLQAARIDWFAAAYADAIGAVVNALQRREHLLKTVGLHIDDLVLHVFDFAHQRRVGSRDFL